MKTLLSPLFVVCLSLAGLQAQNPGISLKNMNTAANPVNDFYEYCNGSWQRSFQLPESESRFGSFNEIDQRNQQNIKTILLEASASKTAAPGSNLAMLRDFYNTAMDTQRIEKMKWGPIRKQLSEVDSVKNIDDLVKLKAEWDKIHVELFFIAEASTDLKNSKRNILGISQKGFGLDNRDFYFDPKFESIRKEYKIYLMKLFSLIGCNSQEAEVCASAAFDTEKRICQKALTSLEMRDMEKMYNLFDKKKLQELIPNFKWNLYFGEINVKQPDTVLVTSPAYLQEINSLLSQTNLDNLKKYAKAQLLMAAASFLSSDFVKVNFDFRGHIMSGANAMKPRWERVSNLINERAGDLISEPYVKRFFPQESKNKVLSMIDNMMLAYRERIASRTWMSDETKKEAYRKLDLLIKKVGYPDKWKDLKSMNIKKASYWDNVCAAANFSFRDNMSQLNKPVDRNRWLMTPATVNAYYEPTNNEITFPAAILQPPFFDASADDAANYGTMGAIIGHELTHGFDDQGSQFNADGNMKMWWTEKDYANFKERTKLIIEQFNRYIGVDTMHVNGSMTQGENIADLGGLTMAFLAYKKSLNGKPSPVINGFTGEQRFFIAWAQGWKEMIRPEEAKRLMTIDYHSPAHLRAIAPLSNMPEFYEAFKVKEGDKMYTPAERRVEIW